MKGKNIHIIVFSLIAFFIYSSCKGQSVEESKVVSCGHAELDALRISLKVEPTSSNNVEERRAAIIRLWRLLWRQGIDMSLFDTVANDLLILGNDDIRVNAVMDNGFKILEDIILNPTYIEEIKGKSSPQISSVTNWPAYHGVDGSQNGFSPDKGPETGEVVWKFPKTNGWNASVIVRKGKVYTAGAGTDVIGYCLDQKTGSILWKGRTYSDSYYNRPGAKATPQISKDQFIVRTGNAFNSFNVETGKKEYRTRFDVKNKEVIGSETIINLFYNQIISCNDPTTGKQLWQFYSISQLAGAPAITEDCVYFTNTNNVCYKINRKNGKVVWKKEFRESIRGNTSFVSNAVLIGLQSGQLISLDAETGKQDWSFTPNNPEPRAYDFYGSAIEADGKIYIGTADTFLYCLDVKTGKKLWDYKADDWIRSKPVIVENIVFYGDLSGMGYALNITKKKPKLLWKEKISEFGFTADIVGNSEVILYSDRNMMLTSITPKTGKIQWKHSQLDGAWIDGEFFASGEVSGQQSSPTVVDGVLYIASPDGFVNAINTETGKELWKFETKSVCSPSPTVAEGKVFVGQTYNSFGQYFALDKDMGTPIWVSEELGSVWVNAVYAKGKLLLGNMEGDFFAIEPSTGKKLWSYFTAKDTSNENKSLSEGGHHGWPPGVHCNPAVEGDLVYTGSWSGYYFAFDIDSGDLIWRCKTQPEGIDGGLPDSAAPVIHKEYVYVQKAGSSLGAINKHTGKIDWEWKAKHGWLQNGTVAALDDMVFGSTIRQMGVLPYNATIHAFKDVESGGELLWEYKGGGGVTAPVITKNKLIFGSSGDPFLSCLNPKTGEVIWKTHVGGIMLESVPAIYGDRVFALVKNGYLFAVE